MNLFCFHYTDNDGKIIAPQDQVSIQINMIVKFYREGHKLPPMNYFRILLAQTNDG